jgi:hypothetical protein
MLPDPGWAGDDPQGQYAFSIQAMLKGELGNEPDVAQDTVFWGSVTSFMTHAFGRKSPASAHAGWKWTTGAVYPFYGIPVAEGGMYKELPMIFDNWLEDSAFLERLKFDPVSGLTTPDGCQGLFDPQDGSAVAAEGWKNHRILAQMIPERTLPAGGAGGSGVAGVAKLEDKYSEATNGEVIEVFDMQTNRNGWPQEREDPVPGNGWRHGDIREVAYVHVWKAWQEIVNDGELSREP